MLRIVLFGDMQHAAGMWAHAPLHQTRHAVFEESNTTVNRTVHTLHFNFRLHCPLVGPAPLRQARHGLPLAHQSPQVPRHASIAWGLHLCARRATVSEEFCVAPRPPSTPTR